jgi:hypothetical protein
VLPQEQSLGHIWRELIPETPPPSGVPSARDQAEPGRTGE